MLLVNITGYLSQSQSYWSSLRLLREVLRFVRRWLRHSSNFKSALCSLLFLLHGVFRLVVGINRSREDFLRFLDHLLLGTLQFLLIRQWFLFLDHFRLRIFLRELASKIAQCDISVWIIFNIYLRAKLYKVGVRQRRQSRRLGASITILVGSL